MGGVVLRPGAALCANIDLLAAEALTRAPCIICESHRLGSFACARRQMTKTGMRKTERYLPVGTVVTCVGELSPNYIRTPVSSTPAGACVCV